MVTVQEACALLDGGKDAWLLDVRSDEELEKDGRLAGSQHIHITQVPRHMDEIPRDRPLYIVCASGLRSTIAASLLQRQGWDRVNVVLGGLSGWNSIRCPEVSYP
jgi:hydroxyacylglutathione hydrolase